MDDLFIGFESLKLSAFSKFSKLNGDVHNVTIGPDSVKKSPPAAPDRKSPPRKPNSGTVENVRPSGTIPFRQIVKDLEAQRHEKVQKAIDSRLNKFEEFSKSHDQSQWLVQQQAFINSMHQQEQHIMQAMEQYDGNRANQNEKLIKHYKDMIQKKMQVEQQIQKNRERQRILHENVEIIMKSQREFCLVYQDITKIIKTCTSGEKLKTLLGNDFNLLKTLPENIDGVISKCKTYEIGEEEIQQTVQIVAKITELKRKISDFVATINNEHSQEMNKKQQVEVIQEPTTTSARDLLYQCISESNLKTYSEIKQFLEQYSEKFKNFVADELLKQHRFDCKKAVNIPLNGISAVNPDHLKDKYRRLSDLLMGKNVTIGDKVMNATARSPQGTLFCTDLLAKRFVLQGDLMISSNPEAAFCYATIIVTLWNDFPDFGTLILGYFYLRCPYLVPFYIPKTKELSDEQYYQSLGYQYTNGQIEKQDKFLKRMTGIMRLYFAILIAKPKVGHTKNPHNIKHGWKFLTSILKLEPQLDVTATAIHTFLETVGFEMENVYGKAFKKLVGIISSRFMPTLKKIDSGGPVSRLEILLQDYHTKGHFERPNGVLSSNFW